MLFFKNKLILIHFFLVFLFNANAADLSFSLVKPESIGLYSVGIGSLVNLKTKNKLSSGPSLFLGSTVAPNGASSYLIFLNKASLKVFYFLASDFKNINSSYQTVLDPYPQVGGTCTGYAIYDFLQQTHLAGFIGLGSLALQLSTEEGRANLLVDSINQYYLNMSHRYSIKGILNSYGSTFGFSCKSLTTNSYETAKQKIIAQLNKGLPVIFSFPIGPNMANAPFDSSFYNQPALDFDNRLWIPRKIGERNRGGHTIVAAASFELNQKTYLVMIDSDWSEPRIWDLEAFLDDRAALDEIEFLTCH